jgi:hypothetical protein
MSKKTLSDLYEQGLLSESTSDEFLSIVLQRQQRQQFKDLLRKEAKKTQLQRVIWASATACVLLCGGIAWKYAHKEVIPKPKPVLPPVPNEIYAQVTPQKIFDRVAPPPLPDNVMMGVEPVQNPLEGFKMAYESQNYARATQFAAQIPVDLQVCLGYSYLQTGDYDKSIAVLEAFYRLKDKPKEHVRWCLGLAHGLKGDWKQMKTYLREIQPRQYQYEAAQQLLRL